MATPRAGALKQPFIHTPGSGLAGPPTRFSSSGGSSRGSVNGGDKGRARSMLPLAVLVFSLTMAAAMLLFLSTMQTPAQTSLASQGGHMNRRMFPGYHSIESTQQLANKLADPSSSDKAVDVASTVAKSAAQKAVDAVTTVAAAVAQTPVLVQKAARIVANVKELQHPFESLQHYYTLQPVDSSPRCQQSGICDGDHSCGPDALGCVTAARDRQVHIRRAIAWSWESYRKYAWGSDEADVVGHKGHALFGLGLTIVDSLDTLLLAGLTHEYKQARDWVADHLEFRDGSKVQFFEVNIRILGGLLSAYYLGGGDPMYLHKAQDLADRLLVAFNTTTGMPANFVTFQNAEGRRNSGRSDVKTNIAEAGTMSLEFTALGRLLGRQDLSDAATKFWHTLSVHGSHDGLYCMGIDTSNADCSDPKITIGAAADSMYEYMLKQWLLSGKTQQEPLKLYKAAAAGVRKHLVRHIYDGVADMTFVSEATLDKGSGVIGPTNDNFEHLTCFAGGMFVLGKLHDISTNVTTDDLDDITLGARIGRACYETYHQSPTGVAPDSIHYANRAGGNLPANTPVTTVTGTISNPPRHLLQAPTEADRNVSKDDSNRTAGAPAVTASPVPQPQQQASSAPPVAPSPLIATWSANSRADFLRPEAVETLFYLWRATGDEIYREWGWSMFRGFERYCRLETLGYSVLEDVYQIPPKRGSKMESFWIAETLKYFYLLFEDDPSVLPLDQWVFNTEAHPLPIWGTQEDQKAMRQAQQMRNTRQ